MSLVLNEVLHVPQNTQSEGSLEDHRDLASLETYLAIVENNQKSCRFIPNDAMLALDMAGFVSGRLHSERWNGRLSAARLSLALVQPCAPVQ